MRAGTAYAFHLLVGHHGVFSLTPFTLLTVAGIVIALRDRRAPHGGSGRCVRCRSASSR